MRRLGIGSKSATTIAAAILIAPLIANLLLLTPSLAGDAAEAGDATTAPAHYDFSSPRGAAESFLRAVDAADAPAVRQSMLAQTPEQSQLADAFVTLIVAG